MSDRKPVQDLLRDDNPIRRCWGCGADNPVGLHIKSFLEGDEGIAQWRPREYHTSYPEYLNGGIACTLIDCHSACTAMALECRELGIPADAESDRLPKCLTKALSVEFLRATPVDKELTLRARIVKKGTKSRTVACSLYAGADECVRGKVTVVMTE
ncbi:MAG: PaaI family thioesterase [Desulfomonile sp.]|nr:PaaI family thioesterase [Desulfomonile sp.]